MHSSQGFVRCLQLTRQLHHPRTTSRGSALSCRMVHTVSEQIALLAQYSACDVSDALLKLQKPAPGQAAKAGYLADLVPFAPSSPTVPTTTQPKIIAPASTLTIIDKSDPSHPPPADAAHLIPKGSHWSDVTEEGTVLVIQQPSHQACAAIGGIMASRMKVRGVAGCVVQGRVRDLAELKRSGLPIWALSRSTVGQGAEATVHSRNTPLLINGVAVNPGDMVFCDPIEGVVVIPKRLVEGVLDLMPKLVEADERVKRDVEEGSEVAVAFKKHRG